jgi:hypothetical protein
VSKESPPSNPANNSRTAAGLLLLALLALAAALPVPAAAVTNSYVALGDSYTAGPGILPQDTNFPGCLRSLKNYPHLVAADRNLQLTDVSCSGAKSDDMTQSQNVDPNPDPPPQFDALKATTKTVTITIAATTWASPRSPRPAPALVTTGPPARTTTCKTATISSATASRPRRPRWQP